MGHHQVVVACRDYAESEKILSVIGQPSTPVYHRAGPLLDHLSNAPDSFLVLTPLIMDETANGILTKCAIDAPTYSVLYALHTPNALNILRLFGCGCAHILGPDELDLLPSLLSVSEDVLNERVMPPFFIDDDESSLKEPSVENANPLHISFLGNQALMSCCNALLNISASESMSMACLAPVNAWALEHFKQSLNEFTLWHLESKPKITTGSVTLCKDFKSLASLEPACQHYIVCHGLLSEEENAFLEHQPNGTQIFTASDEGYIAQKVGSNLETAVAPEKLWAEFISSLYAKS